MIFITEGVRQRWCRRYGRIIKAGESHLRFHAFNKNDNVCQECLQLLSKEVQVKNRKEDEC